MRITLSIDTCFMFIFHYIFRSKKLLKFAKNYLMVNVSVVQRRRAMIPVDGNTAWTSIHSISARILTCNISSLLPTAFYTVKTLMQYQTYQNQS